MAESTHTIAKLGGGLKWPTFLAVLGLAYQTGYWSVFNINVFAFAKLADLVSLAIAPLFSKFIFILGVFLIVISTVTLVVGSSMMIRLLRRSNSKSLTLSNRRVLLLGAGLVVFGIASMLSASDLLPENCTTGTVSIRLRMPAGRAPRCVGNGSRKSRSSGS